MLCMSAHGTEVPAKVAARSATVRRENHGASSAAMVSRWVYRSLQVEKSAYSTRSRKAKVLASLVAWARSANCCRVIAATMILSPSAVAKSRAKPAPFLTSGTLEDRASATQTRWAAIVRAASSAATSGAGLLVMSRGGADVAPYLRWPQLQFRQHQGQFQRRGKSRLLLPEEIAHVFHVLRALLGDKFRHRYLPYWFSFFAKGCG